MRIYDVVTEFELDVLERAVFQILQQVLFGDFGNDVLLGVGPDGVGGTVCQVCK
jgi:hypothetical protein